MDNNAFLAIVEIKTTLGRDLFRVRSKPMMDHVRTERRARPALRSARAGAMARPGRVQFAAQRKYLSARLPDGITAGCFDLAALRGLVRGRARHRRGPARLSPHARLFS